MRSIAPLNRSLSRRRVLQGAAAGAGAALVGGGTHRTLVRAQESDLSGSTVVWMSNQRHDREVKRMLFDEFEEATGIKVDMQIFADEYANQLKLAFESGTPPDIYNMSQPRQEVAAGWPEPVDAYLEEVPELKESFLPGAFVPNRGIWDGQTYGLPMYAQTMRLFYNRTIFENAGLDPDAPPATYAEMRQMAKEITDSQKDQGVYGLILGDKFTWVWWMNVAIPANGWGTYHYDWKNGEYNFDGEGIQEALQLMIDMKNDGSIFPGIHTLTDDDARQQFALGRAGMIIGGSWNPGVFNDQFDSTEDWTTAELPAPESGLAGRYWQTMGDRYSMTAASEQKEAAWEVLKFIYSVDTMTRMYELGMGVMGVAAANTGESDVRGVPGLAPTERDLIVPPEPELPTMTPDYQTVMQEIWDNDGENMAEQLTAITEEYNAAFAEAVEDGKLVREDFVIPDFDPLTWQPPQ